MTTSSALWPRGFSVPSRRWCIDISLPGTPGSLWTSCPSWWPITTPPTIDPWEWVLARPSVVTLRLSGITSMRRESPVRHSGDRDGAPTWPQGIGSVSVGPKVAFLRKASAPTYWDMEKILDSCNRDGRREFLIKWLGYPPSFNRWTSDVVVLGPSRKKRNRKRRPWPGIGAVDKSVRNNRWYSSAKLLCWVLSWPSAYITWPPAMATVTVMHFGPPCLVAA